VDERRLFRIYLICLSLIAAPAASAQSIPAKILEASERTYQNKIGTPPDRVESALYPLLEPCVLSPTAMLDLEDGSRRVVEQPISEEGKLHLREIDNLSKKKRHEKLYELNRLFARDRGFVKALTLRGKVFLDMKAYHRVESTALKAIEANPIDYQAYTYLGYSYLKRDELVASREAYIKSVLYNPNNDLGWKGLKSAGVKLGFDVVKRRIKKRAWLEQVSEDIIDLYIDAEIQDAQTVGPWMSFITAKAAWLYEGVFEQKHPEAESYVYTVEEDLYAYDFMLEYWQYLKSKQNVSDPDLDFLLKVRQKGLLPAYFLFEEAGPICPEIIAVQPGETLQQIKTYIETFVLVPKEKPDESEAAGADKANTR
jgi:tetratricopeptide (TPR) repeat protein